MSKKIIAIIWWWAAWMMAAASIVEWYKWTSENAPIVYLFEKNSRLGAKVIISWGGRCNVTTGTFKRKELLQHYTRGAEFLDYAFREFGPKKVRAWFEDHGVPLKQEDDGRIFPVSDDGKDVVKVFEELFKSHDVNIQFKEWVEKITRKTYEDVQDHWWFAIQTDKTSYEVDYVVIATWWEAYAHTWSSWDWYSFARDLWHTITQLWPSLNSFMSKDEWIHDCKWISFPTARLHIEGEKQIKEFGPVLLTHFGITWPHVFVMASHSAFKEVSEQKPLHVRLQIDIEKWYERRNNFFLKVQKISPRKQLINVLATVFPKRFIESFLVEFGFDKYYNVWDLKKEDRKRLCQFLGNWIPLSLVKRRPWDEFVTAWWVVTDEVNPKTMESKISPWAYFVWEVLNVDWVTWWYNLQASWAAGKMAGESIYKSC